MPQWHSYCSTFVWEIYYSKVNFNSLLFRFSSYNKIIYLLQVTILKITTTHSSWSNSRCAEGIASQIIKRHRMHSRCFQWMEIWETFVQRETQERLLATEYSLIVIVGGFLLLRLLLYISRVQRREVYYIVWAAVWAVTRNMIVKEGKSKRGKSEWKQYALVWWPFPCRHPCEKFIRYCMAANKWPLLQWRLNVTKYYNYDYRWA